MTTGSVRTDRSFYEEIYRDEESAPWSRLTELDRRTLSWLKEYGSTVPKPRRVIDLGAGEGRITNLFAEESYASVGLDLLVEPLRVATAKTSSRNASFVQASAFRPPFASGEFSVLVDYGLLHHVRKTDWPRYREVLEYLLVRDALCFFSVFHETDEHANRTTRKWVYHRGHYDRFFETDDLERCLGDNFSYRDSGLVHDDEHTFLHALFRYQPENHD